MERSQKMIVAAQRAARRLSRSEGTSFQSCLDAIARSVGRRHWADFIVDPVAIDEATRLSAVEPDHRSISHDAQLVACVEHALALDAGSFMAGPSDPEGRALLLYSGRGSRFDHGVDARGVSLHAIAASIRAAATDGDRAMIQDVPVRWSVGDRRIGEEFLPVVTVTLDGSDPQPDMSLLSIEAPARDDREAELRRRATATDRSVDEAAVPEDASKDCELIDSLFEASLASGMYDIEIEPGRLEATIHYVSPSRRRLMRTVPLSQCARAVAVAKDRGRIDQMETRISQYGYWSYDVGDTLINVHVATEPSEFGETLRMGFSPFIRRTYAMRHTREMPREAGILLGHAGLIRRTERRAKAGELIVRSGRSQEQRDSFVANAVNEVPHTDVVVHDPSGGVRMLISERWIRSDNRILMDPRDAESSAFNPLHPDMTVNGIVDAMSSVVEVIMQGGGNGCRSRAGGLMIGLAELLSTSREARAIVGEDRGTVDLPMIHRTVGALAEDPHRSMLDALLGEARGMQRASMELHRHASEDMADGQRIAREAAIALSFCEDDGIAAILSPDQTHDGMSLARSILLRRSPATVIVGDQGRSGALLAGLVLDAVIRIRDEAAGRAVHIHSTRADDLAVMPWLVRSLRDGRPPHGTTVSLGLLSTDSIWKHADVRIHGRASGHSDDRRELAGVSRWIVDDVSSAEQREHVAKAMSVRAGDVPVHCDPVRSLEVTRTGTGLLRRAS